MSAEVIATRPSGPFEAMRLGWGIVREAPGVFSLQVVTLILLGALGAWILTMLLTVIGRPSPGQPLLARLSLGQMVVVYTVDVLVWIFIIGIMRSCAQVADGGKARLSDLFWGFGRGEVWLLAIVMQVITFLMFQAERYGVLASGLQETGNPKHPFLLTHPGILVWTLLIVFLVSLIVGNVFFFAMAVAARYTLPAFSSLRVALETFRRGYRRFLFLNAAWVVVLVAAEVVFGVIMALMFGLLHIMAGSPVAHVVVLVALILAGIIGLIALLAAGVLAAPASFVVASSALQS